MKQIVLAALMLSTPAAALADASGDMIKEVVEEHILPRFDQLAGTSGALAEVAAQDCEPSSPALREAYDTAFDAWIAASHLRFGPTEVGDRAFALAFWPDSRGATPRTLAELIASRDPIAQNVEDYGEVSIAARGFYALEFLLYDSTLMSAGDAEYHCALVKTITADIANTTQDVLGDWASRYAETILHPSETGTYRSEEESLQELFKALATGLQFTSDTRLGRPLGTFDRPRPTRAEARRSGRSSQHVTVSLTSLRELGAMLSGDDAELAKSIDDSFSKALADLGKLDDPVFASVASPATRLKVEIIQQDVDAIRAHVREELGPTLGVAAGFNSLDGD
ncbi:MAG: imelysin family protein [Litoreibacter sp.]|uniref:imelysin family protein n=1 Tax=Litoreibacter sp. TaxID=1969459 RepID=UPI003298E9A5